MDTYAELLKQNVWSTEHDRDDPVSPGRVRLAYDRARTIVQHSGITADDLLNLTPKFWNFNHSFLFPRDAAAFTILTMHWNLALGTIAEFAKDRPDLEPLIKDLENFNVAGMYLLTELDHGLDTRNIETRATLQSDGSFDLHTPHAGAAKTMPPNGLGAGMARMAVVYARLIVQGVDRGIKMFIVPLNTIDAMHPGVKSRALPKRTGARPLDHAITTFTHVKLPGTALLGSVDKPAVARTDFLRQIWRLAVGSLALSITNIPCLRVCGYIAAAYGRRRMVGAAEMSNSGAPARVLSFSTSYRPVLDAFVLASVFEAFARSAATVLKDETRADEVRMAVAHTFKATVAFWTQRTLSELMVRVGWQGVFGYNQISEITLTQVGASIAEGEILVLCIRLATELLLGRYEVPAAQDPNSLLARYQDGLWHETREAVLELTGNQHRSPAFNAHILPRCQGLIRAIGCRMAYEAAASSKSVTPEMLALFESICVMDDASWYGENLGLKRSELLERHVRNYETALPQLDAMVKDSGAENWVTAPLVSEEKTVAFLERLPGWSGAMESEKSYSKL